jgi:RNA polymerase primary sigma factor
MSKIKEDGIGEYIQEIKYIPLISREEEIVLAALIREGNEDARKKLIESNLRLVVKIAHDFKGFGVPLLDLISEGNIGLMRATEKFDPAKGAKFSSYGAWWIKQAMRKALSQKNKTIRIPVQTAGKINKFQRVRMRLSEELGRKPTDKEIADAMPYSERVIRRLREIDFKIFSLQDPIVQGEATTFEDIIPEIVDERGESGEYLDLIPQAMERYLDDRERQIIYLRFGLNGTAPKTLEETSRVIGRTRERVRQIQNKALSKLNLGIRAIIAESRKARESYHRRGETDKSLVIARERYGVLREAYNGSLERAVRNLAPDERNIYERVYVKEQPIGRSALELNLGREETYRLALGVLAKIERELVNLSKEK